MRFEERVVTPEEAMKWLEEKAENRNISDTVVKNYARQMKEGWWQDSPQGICFGLDGKLIDGQHRLWAIVESKTSIKLNIIWDAPNQSFHILDRGYQRSVSFITKIPSFGTQSYQLLITLGMEKNKATPNEIILMDKLLGTHAQSLKEASQSNLKFFASVPIRSAAIVALAKGEPAQYVLNSWKYVSNGTEKDAPPTVVAFIESYNHGQLLPQRSSGSFLRKELFLRARYIFDATNANIETMPKKYFGMPVTEKYIDEVRDIVRRALGNHYHIKLQLPPAQKRIQEFIHPKESLSQKQIKRLSNILDAEQARLSMSAKD